MNTLEVCLLCRYSLPVELRRLILLYFIEEITNENIYEAAELFILDLSRRNAVKKEYYKYYCFLYDYNEEEAKKEEESRLRYGPIEYWDTSKVTEMDSLFEGDKEFNEDISLWDVSNVTTMD